MASCDLWGRAHLLPLSPTTTTFHFLTLNPSKTSQTLNFPSFNFLYSPSSRPNSGPSRARRFRFDDDFGFAKRRKKRRNWSSDDDDDDDDDGDVEFGLWEEPSAIDWLLKILKAFGWMIPAVLVSTMLDTGPNQLIMALVLPLGQTALSLVMDKLWGDPIPSQDPSPRRRARSRSRPRPERNPFETSYRSRVNEDARKSRAGRGSYQSWGSINRGAAKKGGQNGSSFGGWDELDPQPEVSTNYTREEQIRKADELIRQNSSAGKLGMRRNREKPLLFRLVIAVFPFLGSWTRFLL